MYPIASVLSSTKFVISDLQYLTAKNDKIVSIRAVTPVNLVPFDKESP